VETAGTVVVVVLGDVDPTVVGAVIAPVETDEPVALLGVLAAVADAVAWTAAAACCCAAITALANTAIGMRFAGCNSIVRCAEGIGLEWCDDVHLVASRVGVEAYASTPTSVNVTAGIQIKGSQRRLVRIGTFLSGGARLRRATLSIWCFCGLTAVLAKALLAG
jgi:hypothetical protein